MANEDGRRPGALRQLYGSIAPLVPLRMAITGIIVASVVGGGISGVKIIGIAGYGLPASVVLLPAGIEVAIVGGEVYGYNTARRLAETAAGAAVLVALQLIIVGALGPPAGAGTRDRLYQPTLEQLPRSLAAAAIGLLFGLFCAVSVMRLCGYHDPRRAHLFHRIVTMPVLAQVVGGTLFVTLAYGGRITSAALAMLLVNRAVGSLVYTAGSAPLLQAAIVAMRRHERRSQPER